MLWQTIPKPIIALAPMEGFTDSPFRQIVKSITPEVLCYSEFTSVDGLKYESERSRRKTLFKDIEQPMIVQLFGKNFDNFVEAAKWAEAHGAAGLDINMGCPARNVVANEYGAAMIKNPEHAAELVHVLKKNTKLPISVKTRIGFKDSDKENFLSFAGNLINAGISAIAVHGRTSKQGYTGEADWNFAYELKKDHPETVVIGNGDIDSAEKAKEKLKNLDGVMIGRSAIGNPWIMKEIYNKCNTEPPPSQSKSHPRGENCHPRGENCHPRGENCHPRGENCHPRGGGDPEPSNNKPNLKTKIPLILKHCELAVESKGEKIAMLEMRKHLAAYTKGFPGASQFRKQLVLVEKLQDVVKIFSNLKESL